MGQLKYINDRPKVRPSAHYDPNEQWAREPKLSGVIDLRSERRSRRRQLIIEIAVISFGLGWTAHTLILG